MAESYVGEIRMFAGNFAISQWQMCNGQLISISQNQALFAIIGTFYGGNGTTTFQLPDFRGRVPIHQGQGLGLPAYTVGENSGSTSVSILSANMPQHNHTSFATTPGITVKGSNATGTTSDPTNNYLAGLAQGGTTHAGALYSPTAGTTLAAINPASVTLTAGTVTGNAGQGLPINIMPPYLTVTFLISMFGIFPSRN